MSEKIRTAIFGGTFNPIHNGHLAVAKGVLEEGLADELWLLVTPQNPWKRNLKLLDDNIRLEMAEAATRDTDGITASDFEFKLPKPSYTANTLRRLDEAFPQRSFSLVIGADNWAKFDIWYDHQFILDNYPVIVYPRDGYALPEAKDGDVHILECPLVNVSSTEIRDKIAAGIPVDDLIPEAVAELLRLNQAYRVC